MKKLILLSILLLSVFYSQDCDEGGGVGECETDADCPSGNYCNNSECRPENCIGDEFVFCGGYNCVDDGDIFTDYCLDTEPIPSLCGECLTDEWCLAVSDGYYCALDVPCSTGYCNECVSELSIKNQIIQHNYKIVNIYPNPFNPKATISFSIPEFGFTTITAYDITGRQLETLTNEVLSIGNYSINWNASSYPSGVYLIRMDSGDFTQTQKVVLVK